jgi:hypothetical protein
MGLPVLRFVTLTIPNVKGSILRYTVKEMKKQLSLIIRVIRERRCIPISGLIKTEITYNHVQDTYHPHFHLLVDDDTGAKLIVQEWLNRYTTAREVAQDIRVADNGSLNELFKYTTKIVDKTRKGIKVYLPALDTIMQSLYRLRCFQPFGRIKKVEEDIKELDSQVYHGIPEYDFIEWIWDECDWYSEVLGDTLTGYIPQDINIEHQY